MEGQFSDTGMPPSGEPGRDVVKEIDERVRAPLRQDQGGNKSL